MKSSIDLQAATSSGQTAESSPEQAEAMLQQDLEQRHAWAIDQLKIHTAAAHAAESIIRGCEAGIKAIQASYPQEEAPASDVQAPASY